MHVFSLQKQIIAQYESFLTSFMRIKNDAIRERVEKAMQEGKLLPEPLLQFNPAYEDAGSVEELCRQQVLEQRMADIFSGYTLYRHQVEAINLGAEGKDFVVTSGTGSGKSLTYIATIFNHVLRNPATVKGVRAIIVYPMNALINSQKEEFNKYRDQYEQKHGKDSFPISYAQYTGQESEDEKQQVKTNPPDILLTNYMMLELIMTRSGEAYLRENIQQCLEFLAFDELHTYRGRQGSDIALLIRRIQAKSQRPLRFMGTSATLVSGDNLQEQKAGVAKLAELIFGKAFKPEQVINESLKVQTAAHQLPNTFTLQEALNARMHPNAPEDELRSNPLAVWLENRVVLERKGDWIRRGKPLSLKTIGQLLAQDSQQSVAKCEQQLVELLNWSESLSAAKKERSIFPFKLHQFISQTGSVYVSLDTPDKRVITLEPGYYINAGGDAQKPIFPVVFSRMSGHEFICVRKNKEESRLEPRAFHDTMVEELEAENLEAGYLIIPQGEEELWSDADIESLPDAWIQYSATRQAWEAKPTYRNRLPKKIWFNAAGRFSETEPLESWAWYMPAKLLFDPTSGTFYDPKTKENTKLMSLGNEGRSSATTILSYAIVRELHHTGIPRDDQKLLSFTDNRQDAALQAGHFNDFMQVARVRSAIYHALRQAQGAVLDYTTIADSVFASLNLPQEEYAQKPATAPGARRDNEDALKDFLMTRILLDLKRGWRVIMPNLEQCGLLKISYKYLDQDAGNPAFWADLDGVGAMTPEERFNFLENVLDFFRTSYAIDYHKLSNPRQLQNLFLQTLKQPWSIETDEDLDIPPYLRLGRVPADQRRGVFANSIGSNSALGKYLKFALKPYRVELKGQDYHNFCKKLLEKLADCGFLRREDGPENAYSLWQIDVSKILWKLDDGKSVKRDNVRVLSYKDNVEVEPNAFFKQLYMQEFRQMKPLEGREHTGQLGYDDRIEREEKFRKGEISAMFCSPTMELGIDIKNLNVVHMRNVPPSPANYAQRSGRAGRSGQGALVFTYCSSFAPHDRHYFNHKEDMIAGVVATPRMDLFNRDLLLSHVNAIYLAALGLEGIESSVAAVIDLEKYPELPLKSEVLEKIRDGHEVRVRQVLESSRTVLGDILDQLAQMSWFSEEMLEDHIFNFPQVFDKAFNRWRELYRSAQDQITSSHAITRNPIYGTSVEGKNALVLEKQAIRQRSLLLNETGKSGKDISEFYPYRYLASEGFLPGYNFTRLPLRAFLSGDKLDGEYVSRARFMALREFGPRNIVYHKGAKYNIGKMNMVDAASQLTKAKTSKHSGYFFIDDDYNANLCPVTGTPLDGDNHRDLLMDLIPMAETTGEVQERISCEEEERTSTGFDIKTYFSVTGGFEQTKPVEVYHGDDLLLRMYFIPTANIFQVNTRWKRSQKRGFPMGLRSGFWKREKEMENPGPNAEEIRRIMPYTTGNADALYIQPVARLNLDADATTTLLYALKRAVENLCQVEANEIGAYIMGETDRPNIFLFEAAEGSLGVLSQIARDPQAFLDIVQEAYKVCWFDQGQDVHPLGTEAPVASYDDLLSYYNQRDHDKINRFHIKEALELLIDCRIILPPKAEYRDLKHQKEVLVRESDKNSPLEAQFIEYLSQNGLRMPDKGQVRMSGVNGLYVQPDFVFEPNVAIFVDGSVHDKPEVRADDEIKRKALRNAGWQVLVWRYDESIEDFVKRRPDLFYKVKS
jgi:superfamily II DNA or RNA helicase